MTNNFIDMTGALARFASALELGEVPATVKAEAHRLLLDSIGCMIAATRTRMAPIAYGLADFLGGGNVASVVGRKQHASLAGALYVNARLGNCMDLDETFPVGHHFGMAAVVAALALAEERNATGSQFLQAVITGYELGGRVASALGLPMLFTDGRLAGFPTLYSCSASVVFAAAGAAIQLEAQDDTLARQTLGIAGSNTPLPTTGMWASSTIDLPDCKYADAGWATLAGVFAARSAGLGATGFSAIFDGDRGLIKMSGTDRFDPDNLVGGLGSRWMLADITYKPWPTCRWAHHPLTALVKALDNRNIDVEQIEQVVIDANVFLCTPRFRNPAPRTFCSRQWSIPHAVAMILLGIPVGPAWLDPAHDDDKNVRTLREKVRIEHWDPANAFATHTVREQWRNMPARVTIALRDGTRFEAETEFALGDPWTSDTAYGDERAIEKFRTVSGLSNARADEVIGAALNIDAQRDVKAIASALRDA